MKFWDSCALIPLLIDEAESSYCHKLLGQDPEILVWSYTPSEIYSALYRKNREKKLSESQLSQVILKLKILQSAWSEVLPAEAVRETSYRLLAVHPLRAADSLQLAAALIAFRHRPQNQFFVTFDQNLARAANREGFSVLPK